MTYEFVRTRYVTGRKAHACLECLEAIPVGVRHAYTAGKVEGEMIGYRLCLTCELITSEAVIAIWDDGFPLGETRELLKRDHGVDDAEAWARARRAERQAAEAEAGRRRQAAVASQAVAAEFVAERGRQRDEKGYAAEHDDEHAVGELTRAAVNYAAAAAISMGLGARDFDAGNRPPLDASGVMVSWPWARQWWKPGLVRRMLVKAGALIIAEIERLDRNAARQS